jgi:hypothetical protein
VVAMDVAKVRALTYCMELIILFNVMLKPCWLVVGFAKFP